MSDFVRYNLTHETGWERRLSRPATGDEIQRAIECHDSTRNRKNEKLLKRIAGNIGAYACVKGKPKITFEYVDDLGGPGFDLTISDPGYSQKIERNLWKTDGFTVKSFAMCILEGATILRRETLRNSKNIGLAAMGLNQFVDDALNCDTENMLAGNDQTESILCIDRLRDDHVVKIGGISPSITYEVFREPVDRRYVSTYTS